MTKITQEQVNEVIRLHGLWLDDEPGGFRADFSGKDLSGLDFSDAQLTGANFSYANLTDANLTDANLDKAVLWNCTGDGKRIRTTETDRYIINHYDNRCQIGCNNYSLSQWAKFSDAEIEIIQVNALAWWKEWREFVLTEKKGEE